MAGRGVNSDRFYRLSLARPILVPMLLLAIAVRVSREPPHRGGSFLVGGRALVVRPEATRGSAVVMDSSARNHRRGFRPRLHFAIIHRLGNAPRDGGEPWSVPAYSLPLVS